MTKPTYQEFLATKFKFTQAFGFEVDPESLNPWLKPHCRDIVRWALRGGRRAIFAAFGLHKTSIQLEIMQQIGMHEGGRRLIIAPLTPIEEFIEEAGKMGISISFVRSTEQVGGDGIYISNYESVRDGKLDVDLFMAVSLDEASVLRSYGSKTYQEFLTMFGDIKYRFVATATPSPNRHKELIHYAGFLGIMDTGQALTRFFQRDSSQANNLTLYPHMEKEFYTWLHSWAIFIQKPSDLGYSDLGYDLPPIQVRYHEVSMDNLGGKVDRDGQIQLINEAALGLKDAAEEKRKSIPQRIAKVAELLAADPNDHFIVWHDLEDERESLEVALTEVANEDWPWCKGFSQGKSYEDGYCGFCGGQEFDTIHDKSPWASVYGSQDPDERSNTLRAFRDGRLRVLSTKPKIAGSGGNFQRHCHREIFAGIGYKFNDFIQSIYRVQRFGQQHEVIIDIIFTETERAILEELKRKWEEDTVLRRRMSEIIRKYGLSTAGMEDELRRTIGIERHVESGDHFEVSLNDCCDETERMEENSIDLIHTSIPFGNHYEYSASYNDFGHNEDNAAFFRQMDFLTPNLLRILRPGRVAAIHVKDRIRFGNVTGYGMPSVDPFHSDCIVHYRKHGFIYMGMITVVTDVVRENNQTYRLGWSEQCKDGTKMGVGSPEYILLFRKLPSSRDKAYADVRVSKDKEDYSLARWQVDAHSFWRSSGNHLATPDELATMTCGSIGKVYEQHSLHTVYDHGQHVALGESLAARDALSKEFMTIPPASHHEDVWHDVNRMRTLNGEQEKRNLEQHICCLQLDIIERIIRRYTNPGEVVFDPFGGLMSVPYVAIEMGRFGRAAELKPEYFRDGLRYLRQAELKVGAPTLFDFIAEQAS